MCSSEATVSRQPGKVWHLKTQQRHRQDLIRLTINNGFLSPFVWAAFRFLSFSHMLYLMMNSRASITTHNPWWPMPTTCSAIPTDSGIRHILDQEADCWGEKKNNHGAECTQLTENLVRSPQFQSCIQMLVPFHSHPSLLILLQYTSTAHHSCAIKTAILPTS